MINVNYDKQLIQVGYEEIDSSHLESFESLIEVSKAILDNNSKDFVLTPAFSDCGYGYVISRYETDEEQNERILQEETQEKKRQAIQNTIGEFSSRYTQLEKTIKQSNEEREEIKNVLSKLQEDLRRV